MIHAYIETFILTRNYTAAQLVPFDIFLVQYRPAYQMEYNTLSDIIFARTDVIKAL